MQSVVMILPSQCEQVWDKSCFCRALTPSGMVSCFLKVRGVGLSRERMSRMA